MARNPQKPAQGIMLDRDYGDSKFYTVSCDCGDPHDQIKLEVEMDQDGIQVHVWTKVKTDWWRQTWPVGNEDYGTWLYHVKLAVNAVTGRTRIVWRALTRGYVEAESWTILNEQQALNFAYTLHENVRELQAKRDADRALTKAKK